MVKGGLDKVQGRLVVLRHLSGHSEVVQVLPVVGEVLRHMVFIPKNALHAPDQLFHCAVVLLGYHGVGGSGVAGPVHHGLTDGVVQLPAVHAGEHLRAGLLGEVLPAPVIRADGVVGGRLGLVLRRLGGGGQQGRSHGFDQKQGQGFSVFHARFLRFVIWWGFRKPNHTTEGGRSRIQSADSGGRATASFPPAGGIGARGFPLQAAQMYICAMLAPSPPPGGEGLGPANGGAFFSGRLILFVGMRTV